MAENILSADQESELKAVIERAYNNDLASGERTVGTDSNEWVVAHFGQEAEMDNNLVMEINHWRDTMPYDDVNEGDESSLLRDLILWVIKKVIEWLKKIF